MPDGDGDPNFRSTNLTGAILFKTVFTDVKMYALAKFLPYQWTVASKPSNFSNLGDGSDG